MCPVIATQEAEKSLRELTAQVKATLADMSPSPSQTAAEQSESQPSSDPSAGSDSPAAQGAPESEQQQADDSRTNQGAGQTATSQPTDSRAGNSPADVSSRVRSVEREPWFANLPPEVQQAIRAATRSRPPRGYEERLKRYFESID